MKICIKTDQPRSQMTTFFFKDSEKIENKIDS